MITEQKERLDFIKKLNEIQEMYKEKSHLRVKELVELRHKLSKEILKLRDEVSEKRFKERQALLKGKNRETTLY